MMAVIPGKRPPPPPTLQSLEMPAPVGGLNALDAATALPASDCLLLYNLTAAELGLRVRQGWTEWAVGLTGAADSQVRTVLPFSGSHKNGSTDKLFACTSTGIWDVTGQGGVTTAWATGTAYVAGSLTNGASFVTNGGNTYACSVSGTSAIGAGLWASGTAYTTVNQVIASGGVYRCTQAGTSGLTGPGGKYGATIADGTCIWAYVCPQGGPSGTGPTGWLPLTAYVAGNQVQNGTAVYVCATAGTSAASGGPSGTGATITDGTCVWNYLGTGIVDGTCTWNYIASNTAPTLLVTFGNKTGDAGYGTFFTMINGVQGDHVLLYCDEENGYYVYSETGAGWSKVTQGAGGTQINGVDPANLAGVTVWKNRVWFVQKDTSVAWYLGVNAMYGAATPFDFGPRMRSGGPLVNLYSWSYDAGNGMDTLLVGISTGGDVVLYKGTDPSSASTFGIQGSWTVGGVPYGRKIATEFGGELLIMSLRGVVQLSKLVIGAPASVGEGRLYDSDKIAPLFNLDAQAYFTAKGWEIGDNPGDNALVCLVPANGDGAAAKPYVMSMSNRSWSVYRDLPMISRGTWNGVMYFGTPDGRIGRIYGYVDGLLFSDPTSYSPISWSMLTGFSDAGNLRQKKVESILVMLEAQEPNPPLNAEAKYSLDISEAAAPSGTGSTSGGTWDHSTWDTTKWGGGYTEVQKLFGAAGMGRTVAIAVQGKSISRTSLVGLGVMYQQGGLL